jgi:hypothetical protein
MRAGALTVSLSHAARRFSRRQLLEAIRRMASTNLVSESTTSALMRRTVKRDVTLLFHQVNCPAIDSTAVRTTAPLSPACSAIAASVIVARRHSARRRSRGPRSVSHWRCGLRRAEHERVARGLGRRRGCASRQRRPQRQRDLGGRRSPGTAVSLRSCRVTSCASTPATRCGGSLHRRAQPTFA